MNGLVAFFELDDCALFNVESNGNAATAMHRVQTTHEALLPAELSRNGLFPWIFVSLVDQCQVVAVDPIDPLPAEAAVDAANLRHSGLRSVLLIPLTAQSPVEYFLALSINRREHRWTAAQILQLRLAGELVAGAIKRKVLEEEHRDSLKLRDMVAAVSSVAHELSQPLTAILSNADAGVRFMAQDEPDLKEIGEILQDIAADGQRSAEIIQSLRALLRRHVAVSVPVARGTAARQATASGDQPDEKCN
jgi:signal transduction histidine kinase